MHSSRVRSRPPLLFGAVIFAAVALLLSRGALPSQGPPAFSPEAPCGVRIFLGEGFPDPGVHQFSDGITLAGVIELTGAASAVSGELAPDAAMLEIVDGMALRVGNAPESREIHQGWMPARQRLALGIPLHPDRMSRDDWVTLPGIGEKMADQIELDRQSFGDFGRFEALERVKGIGPAKLKVLRPFFAQRDN